MTSDAVLLLSNDAVPNPSLTGRSLNWFLVTGTTGANFLVSYASSCFLLAFSLVSSKGMWFKSSIFSSLILKNWWLEVLSCTQIFWSDFICRMKQCVMSNLLPYLSIWKLIYKWCLIFTNRGTLKMNLFLRHISTFMTVKLGWHVAVIALFVYF